MIDTKLNNYLRPYLSYLAKKTIKLGISANTSYYYWFYFWFVLFLFYNKFLFF